MAKDLSNLLTTVDLKPIDSTVPSITSSTKPDGSAGQWLKNYESSDPARNANSKVPFKKALEKAGIADFHFHDLRHCVTSFPVELKVPESAIMRIQGWSEKDRIDIYRHNPEHNAKE